MGISDSDIFYFLLELRKTGDNDFYSSTEIKALLERNKGEGIVLPNSLYRKIRTLYDFGFLDVALYNFTPKWRVKDKYFSPLPKSEALRKKTVMINRKENIRQKSKEGKAKT